MNIEKPKGFRGKLDKILLGVIVGGAVGSILGLTLAPKSGKETRENIARKTQEIGKKIEALLGKFEIKRNDERKKKGFWHTLNSLFFSKK